MPYNGQSSFLPVRLQVLLDAVLWCQCPITGNHHFYPYPENCLILCGFSASISEVFFWIFWFQKVFHYFSGCLQFVHIFKLIFKKGHSTPVIPSIKFRYYRCHDAAFFGQMPTGHLANALIWLSEWINVYTKPNTSIRALCCQIRLHPFIRQVQPLFNVQLYNITKWIKNKPSHHHNKVWLICKSSLLIQSTVFSPALRKTCLCSDISTF